MREDIIAQMMKILMTMFNKKLQITSTNRLMEALTVKVTKITTTIDMVEKRAVFCFLICAIGEKCMVMKH